MSTSSEKEIKLGFVGDFCLHQIKNHSDDKRMRTLDFCRSLNQQVDVAIANHEFVITPDHVEAGWMAVTSEQAKDIAEAGFDAFCLSNNHIGDYGEEGILYTIDYLEKRGHKTVGAGANLADAIRPVYFEKNGFKIGIVNFCDATLYQAKNDKAGLAPLSKSLINKAVLEAKKNAELVIVALHADIEFTNYPAPWRVSLCRSLAKLKPDLIIQHHPHALQGIEYIGNTLIAYSLGNFVIPVHGVAYGENRPGKVDETVYMTVTVSDDEKGNRKIDYALKPIAIDEENMPYIPDAEKSEMILRDVDKYSDALKDHSVLRRNFFALCHQEMMTLITDTYYRTGKRGIVEGYKFFAKHFKTKSHTNWMRGFFTFGKY